MDKQKVIDSLNLFKERLTGEVVEAFHGRGKEFGQERFNTWRRKFSQFLDDYLPGEVVVLNSKLTHYVYSVRRGESDVQRFWRQDGETMLAYIDSLIMDVENDEYEALMAEHNRLLGDRTQAGQLPEKLNFDYGQGTGGKVTAPVSLPEPPASMRAVSEPEVVEPDETEPNDIEQ